MATHLVVASAIAIFVSMRRIVSVGRRGVSSLAHAIAA
ncbi:hypothetical protein GFS60_06268 (plasmid) [Rhodococcus sp. WAY2]|nr:hypothetical protein GFS60_06268 [Rhodococcus sp. WAY2]